MDFKPNVWHLATIKPRMDELAEINLRNQSIEFFLPRFPIGKNKGKLIFPGYVFLKPKLNQTYQSIRSTKGIRNFVRFESNFACASDETIDELRNSLDTIAYQMDKTNNFKKGDEILIKSGPLKDFYAVFEDYDRNQSVIVLINFLKRRQKVRIKIEAIS